MSCFDNKAPPSRRSPSRDADSVSLHDVKENRDHSLLTIEQALREDCQVDFENYNFILRRAICKSESVIDLREKLLAINRWCFLNVGPQDYGFYSPGPFCFGVGRYVRIIDFNDYVEAYACVVFRHSDDLLAFKLKF